MPSVSLCSPRMLAPTASKRKVGIEDVLVEGGQLLRSASCATMCLSSSTGTWSGPGALWFLLSRTARTTSSLVRGELTSARDLSDHAPDHALVSLPSLHIEGNSKMDLYGCEWVIGMMFCKARRPCVLALPRMVVASISLPIVAGPLSGGWLPLLVLSPDGLLVVLPGLASSFGLLTKLFGCVREAKPRLTVGSRMVACQVLQSFLGDERGELEVSGYLPGASRLARLMRSSARSLQCVLMASWSVPMLNLLSDNTKLPSAPEQVVKLASI